MRSLRIRLIAFAAIAIAVALWGAWHVMGILFEHYTEARIADGLIRQGELIATSLRSDAQGRPAIDQDALERDFLRRASGSYWEVRGPGGTLRSPSLAGRALGATPTAKQRRWTEEETAGPWEEDVIVVERQVPLGAGTALIRVAQDDEPLDRARASFSREMGIFLLALGLALALAAWVQVELGLFPLRRVRHEIAAMRRNPARRLGSGHPREIEPLVEAINALADARGDDLVRARRRSADLAHALKTPLAALAAQNRRARAEGARAAADAIDQTLTAAGAVLEAELARARAAASRASAGIASTRPADLIERLFAVLERTERGMDLVFDMDIPDAWEIGIDPDTFAEIFGNLLDNAARHARRVVRVDARQEGDRILFEVADDGPGIPAERRAAALRRGVRLDEAGSGHGLGLSIVADLVEATEGGIALDTSPSGGLAVQLRWPATLLASRTN